MQIPVASAAASALARLGRAAPLPLPDGEVDFNSSENQPPRAESDKSKADKSEATNSQAAKSEVDAGEAGKSEVAASASGAPESAEDKPSQPEARAKAPPAGKRPAEPPVNKLDAIKCVLALLTESKARSAAVSQLREGQA